MMSLTRRGWLMSLVGVLCLPWIGKKKDGGGCSREYIAALKRIREHNCAKEGIGSLVNTKARDRWLRGEGPPPLCKGCCYCTRFETQMDGSDSYLAKISIRCSRPQQLLKDLNLVLKEAGVRLKRVGADGQDVGSLDWESHYEFK